MTELVRPIERVWVVEPSPGGHRLQYARALVDQAAELGWDTRLLTSNKAVRSAEFGIHFHGWPGLTDPKALQIVAAHDRNSFWHRRRTLRAVMKLAGADDLVVLPEGDSAVLPWLTLLGRRCRTAFLIMRAPSLGRREISTARWKQAVLALGKMRGGRIVELVSALAPEPDRGSAWPKARDLLPDGYFPARDEARSRLGVDSQSAVFLLVGVIDRRKSPEELLTWIDSSQSGMLPVLLAVGCVAEECRALFYGELGQRLVSTGRLILRDGYVDEETLRCAYSAADAVMLLYRNQAPSGAVAFSAVARRPIIAWNNRSITGDVARLGVGVVVQDRRPATLDVAAGAVIQGAGGGEFAWGAILTGRHHSFFGEITGLPE